MSQISKACVIAFSVIGLTGLFGCAATTVGQSSLAGDPQENSPASAEALSAPGENDEVAIQSRPEWVKEHWQGLIGTWVADNTAYKSESEPLDAYGLEWSWGIGEQSLVGRLYGLQDGEEVWTFWEFREFWHPLEGQVITQQFGWDGALGVGTSRRTAEGAMEALQTFSSPAAKTSSQVGHRSALNGNEHTTSSFDVDAAGTWTPQRSYVWQRVSEGTPEEAGE